MFVFGSDPRLEEYQPHRDLFTPKPEQPAEHEGVLEEKLKIYSLALLDAGKVVYTWNLNQHAFSWSENVATVVPFTVDSRLKSESYWLSLIHPDDQQRFADLRERMLIQQGHMEIHYRLVPGNGKTYLVRQTGHAQTKDDGSHVVIGLLDFTEQQDIVHAPSMTNASSHASYHAQDFVEHDYPAVFLNRLKSVIAYCRTQDKTGALIVVNINNLAMIINAYGHAASETVMTQLAEAVRHVVGKDDTVERVHRDQLGIITVCNGADVSTMVACIQTAIQNYGATSSVGSLHVTCTVGSVDFPASANNATDALDKAYIALNSASGIAYRAFEDTREDGMLNRQQMGLANYLRKAIQENRLRLAFQPIVESATGHIAHYEALLRLIGDDGKISSAGALIPIAERMGLIDMIDHIVLDMVMKELEASPKITLAFNVSNLTTDNQAWLDHVSQYLRGKPHIASRMIVEITETAAQRDLRRTAYFVASLQALGCQVALDDFGSGYTSFRQLKSLSVDMVKIDGAFIKDLVDNTDNRFFVKTLLDFTKGFGLLSVAEFVEKGETAKMLMELGVDMMQGYYFGKPENFRGWVNQGEFNRK